MHVSVHVGLRGNEANCVPRCKYVFCTHAHTHTAGDGFFFFWKLSKLTKLYKVNCLQLGPANVISI